MNDFKSTVAILLLFFVSGVSAQPAFKDCPECPDMVLIPAGSFVMGTDSRPSEKPSHTVTIKSFWMGKTEVTQRLWLAVMGSNTSRFTDCGLDCPAENVSWNDAQQFILKLNQKTGSKYRLPSEAEWEYAARAGTTTEWSFGNDKSQLRNYAWFDGNSWGKTREVGRLLPNPFGLFDMHGNVWEWVEDCWHRTYAGAPADGSPWTTQCITWTSVGVVRGGAWSSDVLYLPSVIRGTDDHSDRSDTVGFRLAKDLSSDDVRPTTALKGQSGALKEGTSAIQDAKQKCDELGFETGTEAYGKCVLKLSR